MHMTGFLPMDTTWKFTMLRRKTTTFWSCIEFQGTVRLFLARILYAIGVPQPEADKRFSFEFGARNEFVSQLSDQYCHENQSFSVVCELTIDALAGFDSKNFNRVGWIFKKFKKLFKTLLF